MAEPPQILMYTSWTMAKIRVTVCFENDKVVVPCQNGDIPVRELAQKASEKYRKIFTNHLQVGHSM